MKHKRWVWFSLVLVAIVIAIALLVASLPRLIETKLQAELAKFGIAEFTLGEPYWGLTGAGTTMLQFAGTYQQWRYRVSLSHVQAHYTVQALLDGEVASLGIGAATIEIDGDEQPPSESSDVSLEQIFADLAALQLPIDAIVLNNLGLRVKAADFSVDVTSPELTVDSPKKTVAGELTIVPELPKIAELPTLHLVIRPGGVNWVPDLDISLTKDELPPLEAQAQIRGSANGDAREIPFQSSFNLNMPQGWIETVASHVPQEAVQKILAKSDGTLSLSGRVGLPKVLRLSKPDWYLSLPLTLSGQADMVSTAAEFGLDHGAVKGRFEVIGTGQSLTISSPEPVTFAAELDGEKMGLPPRLTDSEGRLEIEGELRLGQPVTIAGGEIGEAVFGFAIQQNQASDTFRQLSVIGGFSVTPRENTFDLIATENLLVAGQTVEAVSAAVRAAMGWPPDQLQWVKLSVGDNLSLRINPAESSLTLLKVAHLNFWSGNEKSSLEALAEVKISALNVIPGDTNVVLDSRITAPFKGKPMPAIEIKGRGKQTKQRWQISSAVDVSEWKLSSKADWTIDDSFAVTGRGTLSAADVPVLLAPLAGYGYLPIDISLASGRGNMDFRLKYRSESQPEINLDFQAEGLSGIAQGVAFSGAGLSGGFAIDSTYSSSEPVEIAVDQLSSGVVVENIRVVLRLLPCADLAASRWRIDSFSAGIFGGELALKSPGEIKLPELGNSLTFQLSKVQLKNVLSLYEEQGIDGVGILNGEIPVVIEKDGVRIDHGTISAEYPGGKISFVYEDSVALAQTNEQLAMALRLLENFNYEVMSVTTDFSPTGDLTLAVGLVGNNPDEFDGRTVNFNVNFQENLFQLFRVLKLTDGLTRKIEKRLEGQSLH